MRALLHVKRAKKIIFFCIFKTFMTTQYASTGMYCIIAFAQRGHIFTWLSVQRNQNFSNHPIAADTLLNQLLNKRSFFQYFTGTKNFQCQ